MKKNHLVRSEKNYWRKKDAVVGEMVSKLASGVNGVAHWKKKKALKRKVTIFFITLGILAYVAVAAIFILRHRKETLLSYQKGIQYINPVAMLKEELNKNAISADEYAKYLSYLLLHFNRVPERFRPDVPYFSADDVYSELRAAWPKIDSTTQDSIAKELPAMAVRQTVL